jgi:hypothetical protein
MSSSSSAPFLNRLGRTCLDKLEERDIDLLLLEELMCEPVFQARLAQLVLPAEPTRFLEASNSVCSTSHGESDLIAIYESAGGAVAVHLENKIAASFMPEQADRYRRRGEEGVRNGHRDTYVTALVAPRRYLEADHLGHEFDRYIAYEELIPHFERPEAGARGAWRAAMLRQAIGRSRKSVYKRVVDEATTRFFHEYWEIASREFPRLRMKRDRDRPAGSTWVQFYPDAGMPKPIGLWHKAAEIFTADLSFRNTRVEALHEAVGDAVEAGMSVEQAQKSAVVRIRTPPLSVIAGAQAQQAAIREGLGAAARLLSFYTAHKVRLDQVPHA